jgi:translation initiation factor eIF-2B subunit alpha
MTEFDIKQTYLKFLQDDPEITMPVAAIESLLTMLKVKQPSTSAELIMLLSDATHELKTSVKNSISLSAGCDLFTRFVVRNTHLYSDWESCKEHLVENGQLFLSRAKESRDMIAKIGFNLIKDDDTVLIHSYSRVVLSLLAYSKSKFVRFRVFVTEARSGSTDNDSKTGKDMVNALKELDIPVCYIHDSQVGFVINKVDKVFMGAEGVSESGGIINHIGSYQIGVLAKNANKPLYVVSESHKFIRMFPLSPDDIPGNKVEFTTDLNIGLLQDANIDFTPHQYITALVSDLGVLTPSAVSEELIKMWYD